MTNESYFKLINVLTGAGVAVMSFFVLAVLWLFVYYENPPLEVYHLPFEVGKEYKQGDSIAVTVDFCKFTNAPAKIYRTWVGKKQRFITKPYKISGASKGECDDYILTLRIPKNLPPDEYIIKQKMEYNIFPFMKRYVVTTTTPFVVDKKTDKKPLKFNFDTYIQ